MPLWHFSVSPKLCLAYHPASGLQGPQIITVPEFDTPKRYWIVPFLDAYLNFYGGSLVACSSCDVCSSSVQTAAASECGLGYKICPS